jgi:hypothetical protein
MKISFYDQYQDEIVFTDKYGMEIELESKDCLPLPDKDNIIKLNGDYWKLDSIIYNYDTMEIEVYLKEDY